MYRDLPLTILHIWKLYIKISSQNQIVNKVQFDIDFWPLDP